MTIRLWTVLFIALVNRGLHLVFAVNAAFFVLWSLHFLTIFHCFASAHLPSLLLIWAFQGVRAVKVLQKVQVISLNLEGQVEKPWLEFCMTYKEQIYISFLTSYNGQWDNVDSCGSSLGPKVGYTFKYFKCIYSKSFQT